jgi:hypothetical protein
VTSLAKLLGNKVPMEDVIERVVAHFSRVFGMDMELGDRVESQRLKVESRRSKVESQR